MNGNGKRSWLSSRVEVEATVLRFNVIKSFWVVQETEISQWEVPDYLWVKIDFSHEYNI